MRRIPFLVLHPKQQRSSSSSPFITPINNNPNALSSSISTTTTTTTPLPPPELIEPFYDLSDVVVSPSHHHHHHHPSPWLQHILPLVDGSPSMEANLTSFCHKFLITLSPNFVSHTLLSLHNPNPNTASRFFHWSRTQPNYSHSLQTYVSLIQLLTTTTAAESQSQSNILENVVFQLKREPFAMTAPAANSLIKSFGGVGMVEELLWVWRKMKEDGVEQSLYIYNSLMNGLVNSGMVESAERVFEAMKEVVRPDVVSYNTVIKGYCKAGRTRKALDMIREMEAVEAVNPDKVSYMTVMQSCYGEGDVDCCVRLYHEMRDKGLEVPQHGYSLVVCGLCRLGNVVEALGVFEEMGRRSGDGGGGANKAVYTAMIDGYAKRGDVDAAMRLFERMKAEGIEPDEVTYGVVVNGLCKSGRVEEAMGCFEFCKGNGVAVNAVLYSSLIDGLGKAGRVDEAERLFYEMVEKGCPQDSFCYNALIDGLCKGGRIDEALVLFKRMEEEGCEHTVYTYTILISELFKEHRNEEALKLWDMMIDKGVAPNVASFRALSVGLCLSGKVARACKILDELAPMGIVIETAYEDMINVLCKAGRVREACKLADGIVDRGREIPGKVRTLMINALRKAGNADLAIKLMHSKIGIGYDRMRSVKKRVKFQTLIDS